MADACGIPQVHDDWHDLIASSDINAVMIGTWPYTHREMTCAALEAGKHVMCEARMAMNAAEAHAMLQTSQAHPNQVAQIVPSPLTFKVDATVRSMIDAGYIGDLIALKAPRDYTDKQTDLQESDRAYQQVVRDVYRSLAATRNSWQQIECFAQGAVTPVDQIADHVWKIVSTRLSSSEN